MEQAAQIAMLSITLSLMTITYVCVRVNRSTLMAPLANTAQVPFRTAISAMAPLCARSVRAPSHPRITYANVRMANMKM